VAKYDFVYNIFDEKAKKYMVEKGVDNGIGVLLPVTTKLTDLDAEMKEGIAKGNKNMFVANSIEELAGKMGVRPAVLKATLDEYNKFCDQGHDDLFAKDRRYLRPLRTPPFYGLRLYNVILGTLGGIKINEKTEVVSKDGDVIPGLYAIGSDAAGMYGDTYDLYTSGGTLGFAVNSGRIAGENAVVYMGKR
jgi:fumarate reductase flavoprotein subunit